MISTSVASAIRFTPAGPAGPMPLFTETPTAEAGETATATAGSEVVTVIGVDGAETEIELTPAPRTFRRCTSGRRFQERSRRP